MLKTSEQAQGKWTGILTTLGVDAKYLRNQHGPCPVCQGRDRFRFDDKDGSGSYYCSQCGAGNGFTLLQNLHGWDFKQAAQEVDKVVGHVEQQAIQDQQSLEQKITNLKKTWSAAQRITSGDPVYLYLQNRLGIATASKNLRFHTSLYHSNGNHYPAMLARLAYADGTGAGIHRTYLTEDGRKADIEDAKRIMPGKPLNGASVQLGQHHGKVGVAEGIETALAASMLFDMPVWASTTATLMEKWEAPAGVNEVHIFADNDLNFTGQSSAYILAKRLSMKGARVQIHMPDDAGADFADMIAHQ